MKKIIDRKPLMALAIILFAASIAYYRNTRGKEGFDNDKDAKKYPIMARIFKNLKNINDSLHEINVDFNRTDITKEEKDFLIENKFESLQSCQEDYKKLHRSIKMNFPPPKK
jgi:hypothetical protein